MTQELTQYSAKPQRLTEIVALVQYTAIRAVKEAVPQFRQRLNEGSRLPRLCEEQREKEVGRASLRILPASSPRVPDPSFPGRSPVPCQMNPGVRARTPPSVHRHSVPSARSTDGVKAPQTTRNGS